jgi:putative ABC transport system permease protein
MIKLENISKYYYSSNAVVPALRKIKLEFGTGEFIAITGESGSGKSTLLNIISGLDTYDDGELYINGEETSQFDEADWEEYRKNKMGFVFQNYDLIENYSALYNVESSLLIQGYDNTEAKRVAKELLKKVGLEGQMKQRASRLSSGQKQRLSIARALAKDTDIIVADEPTGNLDSETGRQIMELFGELSKDKLIIVVTHNYEEAAPFVTRKVRLHDGEIVSDTLINPKPMQDRETEETSANRSVTNTSVKTDQQKHKEKKREKSNLRIAWRFNYMNITTQPRRVLLFMCFLLFTAAVSFIFLGEIYSNWDDTFTKIYNDKGFLNSDDKRIAVKKSDGSEITMEDMERFNELRYVDMADQYDFVNDINYYIDEGKDYEYLFNPSDNLEKTDRLKVVNFLKADKFMKSATCISENDLVAGRLPENRNEIVLYSKDENVIGTEKACYFTSKNTWGYNNYFSYPVKVVGILKKNSNQVFFSTQLCSMLSLDLYDDDYQMQLCKNLMTGEYEIETSFIPVIGEDLTYGELRISADLVVPEASEAAGESKVTVYRGSEDGEYDEVLQYETMVRSDYNAHSARFVEISEDWFDELFDHKSNQASLYLKDYIYTDDVLNKLADMGYQAISTFRIGSVEYDRWKVAERATILIRSMVVLLIISILELLIISSILKIKHKDFIILGSMGMNHTAIKLMNYFEMLIYTVLSAVLIFIAAKLISLSGFFYLVNIMKYYNVLSLLIYIVFNLLVITITVWSFNRYLRHKQKWS